MKQHLSIPFAAIVLALAAPVLSQEALAARLTVYRSGPGSVTSQPGGISCGSDCTQNYTSGTRVTLTATPASGYRFAGWFGYCSGTSATTTITMSSRATCTASFVAAETAPPPPPPPPPASYTLTLAKSGNGSGTVTSSPAGVNCGSTCAATYTGGTAVTLTAAPAAGSTFSGWSGTCTGTAPTATVTVNASGTCFANFSAPTTVSLSVTKSGTGSGTVTSSPAGISCGSTCQAAFAQGASVTLTAAPAAGSTFVGWSGSCTGSAATATVTLAAAASCGAAFNATQAAAGALYVAITGNDSTGNGSAASPYRTIAFGIGKLPAGGTLIVRDGTYVGNANFIANVKSGTAAARTVVRAENPMGVRIQSTTGLGYYENQLKLDASYVTVDGFIFDMAGTQYPPYIGAVNGGFNTVSRSIFKRAGNIDAYGGLLEVNGSDNLFEDLAGTGACRYCFKQGGTSSTVKRNVWRRIVGRFDYSNSAQPKATFATYGNDSAATNGVSDHLYQNVIAIDGQNPGNNGGEEKYGAFYFIKAATQVRVQGAIVLNEGVGYSGLHLRDYAVGTNINSAIHSVVWDLNGSRTSAIGIKAYSGDSLTIGGYIPGNATNIDTGATPNSLLKPAVKPANLLNNTPGAVVMTRYGKSGTRWGEAGYDQLTTEPLWPWPYEDKIKAVFREANPVPAGNSPAGNNTLRGFAADGTGRYGGPVTLTSYIWEYLGTPCPATACPR